MTDTPHPDILRIRSQWRRRKDNVPFGREVGVPDRGDVSRYLRLARADRAFLGAPGRDAPPLAGWLLAPGVVS